MKEAIAVLFADSHLDLQTWANRPRIQGDSLWSFDYIINRACELDVGVIIGAGDLIDVKKPPAAIAQFIRQRLQKVRECGITFAFIQGQHELSRDVPWFSAIDDHTEHLDGNILIIGNAIEVYGLDWRPGSQLKAALETVPPVDLLVMHQVWRDFMGENCSAEGSFADVPPVPLLLTGDFHTTIDAQYGKLRVLSPGSTSLRSVNEPADKHFFVLYDNGEVVTETIPTRQKLEVSVYDENELALFLDEWPITKHRLQEASAGLPDNLQLPIVWFKYSFDLLDVYEKVSSVIGADAEIFRKELQIAREQQVIERFERDSAVADGLVGCLLLLVEDKDDFTVLRDLLVSTDQAETLAAIAHERGIEL